MGAVHGSNQAHGAVAFQGFHLAGLEPDNIAFDFGGDGGILFLRGEGARTQQNVRSATCSAARKDEARGRGPDNFGGGSVN